MLTAQDLESLRAIHDTASAAIRAADKGNICAAASHLSIGVAQLNYLILSHIRSPLASQALTHAPDAPDAHQDR